MVEETIQVIRETETAADVIVKEAGEKSRKILEDARQEAEQMIKAQKEAHRVSVEEAMQKAQKKPENFSRRFGHRQRRRSKR